MALIMALIMSLPPSALVTALLVLPALFLLHHLRRAARIRAALRNRHVWVVGASRGLGRALALRAASAGACVSITARRAAALEEVAASIKAAGGTVGAVVPADVSTGWAECRAALAAVERDAGEVDVLVANAGVNHGGRVFTRLGDDEVDRVVGTNLLGVVRLFRVALPGMLARPRRCVLCCVSSLAGYRGVPGGSVYGATKAAVTTLCQSLNVELVATDVSVVAVHPGFVDTPAIRGLDHPKPFLVSEERAAELVLDAIVCRRRHYGFPWPMEHIVLRFSRLVPSPLYEWILHLTGDHHNV